MNSSLILADARSALVFQQVTCPIKSAPASWQFFIPYSPARVLLMRSILNREADNQPVGMLTQWNADFWPSKNSLMFGMRFITSFAPKPSVAHLLCALVAAIAGLYREREE